jgi:hypothetical protein
MPKIARKQYVILFLVIRLEREKPAQVAQGGGPQIDMALLKKAAGSIDRG